VTLRVAAFLATGFEETELVAVVDVLRRAGMEVLLVGLELPDSRGQRWVSGAHGIQILADVGLAELRPEGMDLLFLPGGNPGAQNLKKVTGLRTLFAAQLEAGKWVAAICAAPTILGGWGMLAGRRATCYPGMEKELGEGAIAVADPVVIDGRIVTSRGVGASLDLGLALVRCMISPEAALRMSQTIVYSQPN
jgi:4-methyl-5(b-hydroxyethyl)-thiazole monophosphate biosynthesis